MCFWVRSLVRHEYPNSRLSAPKSPGFLNFLFGSEVHNMTMYCSSDVSADLRISALANQLSQLLEINPISTFKWLCNFISGMDPFRNLACQFRNVRSVYFGPTYRLHTTDDSRIAVGGCYSISADIAYCHILLIASVWYTSSRLWLGLVRAGSGTRWTSSRHLISLAN